jgi:hypothetical protein
VADARQQLDMTSLARTAASFAVMTSKCQFIANRVSGLSSRKRRWAKAAKSSRSCASSSRRVSGAAEIEAVLTS